MKIGLSLLLIHANKKLQYQALYLYFFTFSEKIRIFVMNTYNMDTKLTLKLNADAISRAKRYAAKHKTSLSAMVEKYFEALTAKKGSKYLSEELAGCLKNMKQVSDEEIKLMYAKGRHRA
jgi:hypothetical protein